MESWLIAVEPLVCLMATYNRLPPASLDPTTTTLNMNTLEWPPIGETTVGTCVSSSGLCYASTNVIGPKNSPEQIVVQLGCWEGGVTNQQVEYGGPQCQHEAKRAFCLCDADKCNVELSMADAADKSPEGNIDQVAIAVTFFCFVMSVVAVCLCFTCKWLCARAGRLCDRKINPDVERNAADCQDGADNDHNCHATRETEASAPLVDEKFEDVNTVATDSFENPLYLTLDDMPSVTPDTSLPVSNSIETDNDSGVYSDTPTTDRELVGRPLAFAKPAEARQHQTKLATVHRLASRPAERHGSGPRPCPSPTIATASHDNLTFMSETPPLRRDNAGAASQRPQRDALQRSHSRKTMATTRNVRMSSPDVNRFQRSSSYHSDIHKAKKVPPNIDPGPIPDQNSFRYDLRHFEKPHDLKFDPHRPQFDCDVFYTSDEVMV